MTGLAVAWWDAEHDRARLLRDPGTGLPAAFDVELALALARYLGRNGCPAAGIVAAPLVSVRIPLASQGVALADQALRRPALA